MKASSASGPSGRAHGACCRHKLQPTSRRGMPAGAVVDRRRANEAGTTGEAPARVRSASAAGFGGSATSSRAAGDRSALAVASASVQRVSARRRREVAGRAARSARVGEGAKATSSGTSWGRAWRSAASSSTTAASASCPAGERNARTRRRRGHEAPAAIRCPGRRRAGPGRGSGTARRCTAGAGRADPRWRRSARSGPGSPPRRRGRRPSRSRRGSPPAPPYAAAAPAAGRRRCRHRRFRRGHRRRSRRWPGRRRRTRPRRRVAVAASRPSARAGCAKRSAAGAASASCSRTSSGASRAARSTAARSRVGGAAGL